MLPSAIKLRNYRSFADEQRLELKPLTLIYGENNSGKSGLLRVVPMLADSTREDADQALNFGRRVRSSRATLSSIRWKGLRDEEDRTIGVGFEWTGDAELTSADFAIDEVELHGLQVRRFKLCGPDRRELLSGDWDEAPDPDRSPILSFKLDGMGGVEQAVRLGWRGLVPETPANVPLQRLAERLRHLTGQVQWLTSLRPPPEPVTAWSGPIWPYLRTDGSDSPIVFVGYPKVLERVSSWYREHLGANIVLDKLPNLPGNNVRIGLQRANVAWDVDLVDTGEGITQVLPVLTALALMEKGPNARVARILAVEEPEAHLHPRLQRHLADRLCEVAAGGDDRRIVIETHSEILLRAIQLQVATSGGLSQDQVIIYWVRQHEDGRSVAYPIHLDENGRFADEDKVYWEHGAFSHDRELLRKLVLARRAKRS